MKIPYKPLKNGHEKPLVTVVLINPKTGQSVRSLALVDSGSDSCFFDAELGQLIGLDVPAGQSGKIHGVVPDKWVKQYSHSVKLEYQKNRYSIDIGFVQGLSRYGYGILGQRGFFDQVQSITFEKNKNVFEIIC